MKYRRVHLDFHTSEDIENIGERFSKNEFQEALITGHIDSITVFSKCHHGWSYNKTAVNKMHPHLKFDLLSEQIAAAHEIGVETPVYLSAGFDEKDAKAHNEWLYREFGSKEEPDFSVPGYHLLCFNSGYLDKLIAEIEEVCDNYDADGIFLDITNVKPCVCDKCVADMRERGLNPENKNDVMAFAESVYANYTLRVRQAIDKHKKGLPVFHNGGHIMRGRRDLAYMNSHLELESLPTGGWGYDHFPLSASYVRNIGMEYLGMTGKFHTSWGEFGGFKHPNALRYETALNLANGAGCSIGDQLSPSGKPDMVTYNLIAAAYSEVEQKEEYVKDSRICADIALLSYESVGAAGDYSFKKNPDCDTGAVRILLEGKYLFDVIDTQNDFEKYKVIILPDNIVCNDALAQKLKTYTQNGGKLLASGISGLNSEKNGFLFDFGAEYCGKGEFCPDYMHPCREYGYLSETDYVMYAGGVKILPTTGIELAKKTNPYFNRTAEHFCSHKHAPCSGEYGGSGIVQGSDGIFISWKIFEDYAQNGSLHCKTAVCFALDRLLDGEKLLYTNLGAQGIVTMAKQSDRKIVHLLYAVPVKRGKSTEVIEDILPIYDIAVKVKTSKPKAVYKAPQKEMIDFSYDDGYVSFVVDCMENHQMIVIE